MSSFGLNLRQGDAATSKARARRTRADLLMSGPYDFGLQVVGRRYKDYYLYAEARPRDRAGAARSHRLAAHAARGEGTMQA
jgi:hypothetical protein